MKLIIAEKPSVAKSIASALGAKSGADGFLRGAAFSFPGVWDTLFPRWTRRAMTRT